MVIIFSVCAKWIYVRIFVDWIFLINVTRLTHINQNFTHHVQIIFRPNEGIIIDNCLLSTKVDNKQITKITKFDNLITKFANCLNSIYIIKAE